MKKFREFISEASTVGATQMEKCICIAFNGGYDKAPDTFGLRRADYENAESVATAIAADIRKKTGAPPNTMVHFGAGKGTMSSWWKGNPTPKTDIFSDAGHVNISLKQKGGSQIMSGLADETKSTFAAAVKYMGSQAPESATDLIARLSPVLKTMKMQGSVNQMVNAIRKKTPTPSTLTAPIGKRQLTINVDQPQYEKEKQNYLDWKAMMKAIQPEVVKWFEKNPEFKLWFTFEAATGLMKFEPDEKAWSNWVVEFDGTTGKNNAINPLLVDKRPSPYVQRLASIVKIRISPKTPSGSQVNAHGFGSTSGSFRLDYQPRKGQEDVFRSGRTLREWCEVQSTAFAGTLLTEGVLTEDGILSRAYEWLKSVVSALIDKLYELARKGLEYVLSFLEFSPAAVDTDGLELFGF